LSNEATAEIRHRYERLLTAIVDDGVAAGPLRDLPRRPVVKLIFAAINSVRMWYDPDGLLSLEEVIDAALTLLLTGLEER
jgi:hypothetical protein